MAKTVAASLIHTRIDYANSFIHGFTNIKQAQLSQRDRATLRVIEYFAKSLKVIRNNKVE